MENVREKHTRHRPAQTLLILAAALPFCTSSIALAPADSSAPQASAEHEPRLHDYQVIEFRRYTVKPGERKHFAQYFDTYFPEAFQQLGAIAAGSFFERRNPNGFTWIRGFHTMDERAIANAAFYYGSVWSEHRNTLNDLMTDSDNVILLRPLNPERGVAILPAVDPVNEPNGAQGVLVAQVFAIKVGSLDGFAVAAETTFARYRAAGVREAGVLITLDARNNFPQLPVRTDGPYLVWLGILRDNQTLEKQFTPVVESSLESLNSTDLLRSTPEFIVLDPTPRSRLRWLPSWK
jgi:hypothetical protein